jgi:O-antigen ligase
MTAMNAAALVAKSRQARLVQIADGLATAVAVSLPWSTSATAILVVLWLVAVVPTLDPAAVRREVMSAAGGLPIVLWVLAALGMLWADVSWTERFSGLSGFHKLLFIPLLLAQFRRSLNARWVFLGLLVSAGALLAVSWSLVFFPDAPWHGTMDPAVPVKNYIFQSELFEICAFALIGQAVELWRTRERRFALLFMLAAGLFVADIGYVTTSRTTLVVMAVLLVLFGLRQFGWKGALASVIVGGLLAGMLWVSSPYLRTRVSHIAEDIKAYEVSNIDTSVGLRLEYWRNSLTFLADALVIGHGTGSIHSLFKRAATPATVPTAIADNPHNQILAVALQLGLLGALVLIAMWIAHLVLFRGGALVAWFGLVVVVDNIVSSIFNSHLFDFTQGWLYVFGVGVLGGAVLRQQSDAGNGGKP